MIIRIMVVIMAMIITIIIAALPVRTLFTNINRCCYDNTVKGFKGLYVYLHGSSVTLRLLMFELKVLLDIRYDEHCFIGFCGV